MKAIAIEPELRNFEFLKRNIIQNGLTDKVLSLQYAVSAKKGDIQFELSDDNYGDHRVHTVSTLVESPDELYQESKRRVINVQTDQLDNLLRNLPDTFIETISIIWIDVQGYEGFVFKGAKELLSKDIPVICEIWPYGIKKAGMSHEQFFEITASLWSTFCVMRNGRYVRYPINMLSNFLMNE